MSDMPLVDLVELIDDLWFGRPNWYLPYVEAVEAGLRTPSYTSNSVPAERCASFVPERNSMQRDVTPGTSWNLAWFAAPFRGISDRKSASDPESANAVLTPPLRSGGSEILETFDHGCGSRNVCEERQTVGTWADRQTNFHLEDTHRVSNAGSISIQNSNMCQHPTQRKSSITGGDDADKRLRDKAWEWRFRQRWAKEHHADPYTRDVPEDDGLAFMTQHGAHGWHQQFIMESASQTGKSVFQTSFNGDTVFGMLPTPTPTPDNSSSLLRGPKEMHRTANGEATQKIIVAARQANELLIRQAKIEAEVKQRWQECRSEGQLWAGKHLASSLYDMWGEMVYFLVKVADHQDHKFIVRAKHGLANQRDVCQAVRKEIQENSDENGLSSHGIQISVLGSGTMSWNDDATVRVCPRHGSLLLTAMEAAGLVASLLRQSVGVKMDLPEDVDGNINAPGSHSTVVPSLGHLSTGKATISLAVP